MRRLVNTFTRNDHDLANVTGLDKNTAMPLANSKTIFDDVTRLHSRFSLPVPKFTHTHGSIMLPPRHPRVLARVTRQKI